MSELQDRMQARRIMGTLTPEQQARLEEARRQALAEKADMIAQKADLDAAAAQPTLSGQLRQAIHATPLPLPTIAQRAGVSTADLGEFLRDEQSLPSDAMDRLAMLLGYELTPAGSSGTEG